MEDKDLAIAKLAYKQISEVIQQWEATGVIVCCWDGCIRVDGVLFHDHELEDFPQGKLEL